MGSGLITHPVLYLSGPYAAAYGRSVDANVAVAARFAVAAWRAGWAALCPHLNTWGFEHFADLSHRDWVTGDLAFLERMTPGRDAVLMLPHWEQSAGATLERAMARLCGLTIYEAEPGEIRVPEARRD